MHFDFQFEIICITLNIIVDSIQNITFHGLHVQRS